jgi:hypothetical protein
MWLAHYEEGKGARRFRLSLRRHHRTDDIRKRKRVKRGANATLPNGFLLPVIWQIREVYVQARLLRARLNLCTLPVVLIKSKITEPRKECIPRVDDQAFVSSYLTGILKPRHVRNPTIA